ncbi:flagellar protein [Rhizobium sp.]|uniref:flagellar protein n=1 Tax=Rhizobium sp. TaxID=391 RepID=UPI002F186945
MKESDADEPVAPPKLAKRRTVTDRALACTGLVLAGISAFFPWYVFLNPDKFGIQVAEGDRTRDLPNWPGREIVSVSPLAMVNKNPGEPKDIIIPDPLTTATVSSVGREDDKGPPAEDQPFPGKSPFHLLHVANGRALIEDDTGMFVVRVGSLLPDNSRLATIEQRDGKWVIVTSTGDVYSHE